MSFFVTDFSVEVKNGLEKILGVRGYYVNDVVNWGFIKAVVTEPAICLDFLDDGDLSFSLGSQEGVLGYKKSLSGTLELGLPVIVYSEIDEKKINSWGFNFGIHYIKYFNKTNNSLSEVADFIRPYLLLPSIDKKN